MNRTASKGDPSEAERAALIVDDNEGYALVMAAMIHHIGFRAICTRDFAAALDVARTLDVDVVLVDADLLNPLTELGSRFWERTRNTPRILVANNQTEVAQDVITLIRPVRLADLQRAVLQTIEAAQE